MFMRCRCRPADLWFLAVSWCALAFLTAGASSCDVVDARCEQADTKLERELDDVRFSLLQTAFEAPRKGKGKAKCAALTHPPTTSDFPVDVVYTWIEQPSKEKFDGIMKDCPKLTGGWQRFRNLNTFDFSFRLLEKNLPWVRKVFIVTPGEVPDWVNKGAFGSSKVEMIKQQDLWPTARWLQDQPIHNSQSVETHLHRIPGLSQHFIYLNDDMFVGRPLERSFFFTDAGAPVMHSSMDKLTHASTTQGAFTVNADWCHAKNPGEIPITKGSHTYSALTIPMVEDAQARWPAMFDKLSNAHCRGSVPAADGPTWFYAWYGIHSGLLDLQNKGKMAFLSNINLDKKGGNIAVTEKDRQAWYSSLLKDPPDVGCINDDFATTNVTEMTISKNALSAFMVDFMKDTPSESGI